MCPKPKYTILVNKDPNSIIKPDVFNDYMGLAAFVGKIVYSVLNLIIKSPFLDLKLGNKVIQNLESNLIKS